MAPLGMIRQLSDTTFVWEIPKFFKLVKNHDLGAHSPDFIFGNTSWDVAMYKTSKDTVHFTNFSLWRKSYSVLKPSVSATYRLYIKDRGGKDYWWSALVSNEFNFDKREGTPQTLRDLDILKFLYYNTPSDIFSLHVTFDSAKTSLVRTGSLRLPRRKSFIKDVIKRRGSFSNFENEEPRLRLNSLSGGNDHGEKAREPSASFSSSKGSSRERAGSFIRNIIRRRGSFFNFETEPSMASHSSRDSTGGSESRTSSSGFDSWNERGQSEQEEAIYKNVAVEPYSVPTEIRRGTENWLKFNTNEASDAAHFKHPHKSAHSLPYSPGSQAAWGSEDASPQHTSNVGSPSDISNIISFADALTTKLSSDFANKLSVSPPSGKIFSITGQASSTSSENSSDKGQSSNTSTSAYLSHFADPESSYNALTVQCTLPDISSQNINGLLKQNINNNHCVERF